MKGIGARSVETGLPGFGAGSKGTRLEDMLTSDISGSRSPLRPPNIAPQL
jgi:hypothetical protein